MATCTSASESPYTTGDYARFMSGVNGASCGKISYENVTEWIKLRPFADPDPEGYDLADLSNAGPPGRPKRNKNREKMRKQSRRVNRRR